MINEFIAVEVFIQNLVKLFIFGNIELING